jgi:hypothetical protein
VSTILFTLVKQYKARKTIPPTDITLCVAAPELSTFEHALAKNKPLKKFFERKLRHEWNSTTGIFTIRIPNIITQEICEAIAQRLRERFMELADSKHISERLDSWERTRVNELVELISPLDLKNLKIGQEGMSPDLSFVFGTTDSLLGAHQLGDDPLVVFEVRALRASEVRDEMEERAKMYLGQPRFKCPFRHNIKTVILIYYTPGDPQTREVYITISRVVTENGKRIITSQNYLVDPFAQPRSGRIELSLSDFLPNDAIELGFKKDENSRRACDHVKVDIDITDAVWPATRRVKDSKEDASPSTAMRKGVENR